MSIKPQWVAKILNGEKTIEIRKKFPKDYVGWVYIYCSAEDKNGYLIRNRSTKKMEYTYNGFVASVCWLANHKVVARFWCDKVEEIKRIYPSWDFKIFAWETETLSQGELEIKACLETKELRNYLAFKENGYAIHITKLEIFDKPKEIREFEKVGSFLNPTVKCPKKDKGRCNEGISPFTNQWCGCERAKLNRAPQSWCYIED